MKSAAYIISCMTNLGTHHEAPEANMKRLMDGGGIGTRTWRKKCGNRTRKVGSW